MLAYLEVLCSALIARDIAAIERLRADPRAASLPAGVLNEIAEFLRLGRGNRGAPIHTLHLYYQIVQLHRSALHAVSQPAPAPNAQMAPTGGQPQIELPLFAA